MFRLGGTLAEAYRVWSERVGANERVNTIGDLLDRYGREVVPTKAPKTQTDNLKQIVNLRRAVGDWQIGSILPKHIYQYMDKRSAKVSGRREIALLSHAYTKAVEWGYLDRHPFKGEVRLKSEAPRTRYVEDWELDEVLGMKPVWKGDATRQIQCFIKLRRILGMRGNDLLMLRVSDAGEDGIRVTANKTKDRTGKTVIYLWTDKLRALWDEALELRAVKTSEWLFCSRRGQSYYNPNKGTSSGWHSMWQRFMNRALKETKLKVRFTSHDIRAKAASDAESAEHAQALLAHSDAGITKRVYRRKPDRVLPLQ